LGADLRLGIVGTDTSHAVAFTSILNDPAAKDYLPGARVVAAFKGGSPDIEESASRVDKYADELHSKYGVEIVPDIATLLSKVDAVLLESVDGRAHLALFREIVKGHKPVFIDKPLASTSRRSPGKRACRGSRLPLCVLATGFPRCALPA
jgi:predicted dehydrogenase